MITNSSCVGPGSELGFPPANCCPELARFCLALHDGEVWFGHSCFWDSYPSGMSAVLRGLVVNLGGLYFTDLEDFTTSGGLSANRTFQNFAIEGGLIPITHSQTTIATATIKTSSRTDTGTASITIDQLRLLLRVEFPNPYIRSLLGTVYIPPTSKSSTAGNGIQSGNSRHVHYKILPSFRLTINSLAVNTLSSTAWTLNSGQSPVTVNGSYAGPYQYGVPDLDKCSRVINGVQAIAIAPTFNCTAGGESGVLTLRSESGAYPVWLGVGARPVASGDGWVVRQRLPAFDLLANTGVIGFPPCNTGSFSPIDDERDPGGPVEDP